MADKNKLKNIKRLRRKNRVRSRIFGTTQKPRMTVYRSLKHVYVQVIDDSIGKTLVSASDFELTDKKLSRNDKAKNIGKIIAEKCQKNNIKKVVFDRNGYIFHGVIKTLADMARENGLEF